MSYYSALDLKLEPFSTSPDPAFFYRSPEHASALERLATNIRMKRGMNLVLGDVGTGKTTLGRVLSRDLSKENDIRFHLILNPLYQSEFQFLEGLCRLFHIEGPAPRSTMDCLELLQNYLYEQGVKQGLTTVLLVDEGQNLSLPLMEVMRSLLNYETNEHKLLQLVILAQLEALPRMMRVRNFMDRVALKYVINPFDVSETKRMVLFRLAQAGLQGSKGLFTDDSLEAIHESTSGYPRRINRLCQMLLENMAGSRQKVVTRDMVERETKSESPIQDAVGTKP